MQEPPRFQVVGLRTDGKQVVVSRHAILDVAEQIADMLVDEGYRQIRVEAEDEQQQRAA